MTKHDDNAADRAGWPPLEPADWTPETLVTPDGVERCLGLIPTAVFGTAAAAPPAESGYVIPRGELEAYDDWPEPLPILDQGSTNACTYFSSCQALSYARYEGGQGYVALDPIALWSRVTGGRNVGTNILQAGQIIEQYGMPPAGLPRGADVGREAARFKMQFTVTLTSWPRILTAVAMRLGVVGSVCAGPAWNVLDGEGVPGVCRGQANHAIFLGGGLRWSDRWGWCVKHAGSWGTRWGDRGFAWYTEAHFDNSLDRETYVTRTATEDMAVDVPEPVPLA